MKLYLILFLLVALCGMVSKVAAASQLQNQQVCLVARGSKGTAKESGAGKGMPLKQPKAFQAREGKKWRRVLLQQG